MKKIVSSFLIAFLCLMMAASGALAHPGRTDGQGGHKDNNNKSGLGSYHYHCGGSAAHLHTNGYCPYASGSSNSPAYSSPSPGSQPVSASPKAQVPSFQININGSNINTGLSEYPPLLYQDITYIPLTSDFLNYLKLIYTWDDPNNIIIDRTAEAVTGSFTVEFQNGYSPAGTEKGISISNKGIMANSINIGVQYPIFICDNIYYLPLTSDMITALGFRGGWNPDIGFDLLAE